MVSQVIDAMVNNGAQNQLRLTSSAINAAYKLSNDYTLSDGIDLLIKVQETLPAPSLGIITSIGDLLCKAIDRKEPINKIAFLKLGESYMKFVKEYRTQEWSSFGTDFAIEDILAYLRINNMLDQYSLEEGYEKNFDRSYILTFQDKEDMFYNMNLQLNE